MTTDPQRETETRLNGASTAELVRSASEQMSRLMRDEVRLALAEMKTKGRQAGVGAGMLGAAGVTALYGVAALLATVILLLALVMPAWLAALIVAVVLFAVAGVMALVGRRQVRQIGPPVPEEAVASVKADVHVVSDAVKERGAR
jgi:Flp pilus assembly protein TadB